VLQQSRPQSAYRRTAHPANNHYVVVRYRADRPVARAGRGENRGPLALLPFVRRPEPVTAALDPIIGFAGMWVLFDEAHVTTIGVLPRHRGKGLGELMLIDLFEEAARRGAEWLTLEVRVSNESAQSSTTYGFTRQGLRRRYYSDNGEDAYIMWSPSLRTPEFNERFERLRAALRERLPTTCSPVPTPAARWPVNIRHRDLLRRRAAAVIQHGRVVLPTSSPHDRLAREVMAIVPSCIPPTYHRAAGVARS
jgi:ribosomal-protein-alanine N-acetyltransferase